VTANLPIEETTPSVPRKFLIAHLLASVGFGLVAMTICLPSMQEWGGLFAASQADVQLTFSSFVIALGASQVLYGPLSDRYGRRRLLLVGFALAALGSIASALAPTLDLLTLARALQGAGAAAGMVIGRAMVQDYFHGADRPRVMAYVGMVMGMCPPLATIIGGQLHVHLGWRANFLLMSVFAVILMLTTWLVLPASERPDEARAHWLREMLQSYTKLARIPVFFAFAGILAMSSGTFYVFLAGAPIVLASYGVGPGAVGFFIMFVPVSYIAGNFLTSRLIRFRSEAQLMIMGQICGLCGVGLLLLLAWVDVRSPFAVAAPLLLLGLGHGLLMPSALAGTVSLAPALAGTAAGAAGLSQQFSGAFGGYAVGLVEHDGAVNLGLLMMVFVLLSILSQFFLLRSHVSDKLHRRGEHASNA